MSQLTTTTTSATRAPALRDRRDADRVGHDRTPGRSRLWALIEALAYAGAIADPSGIMAVARLRRAQEEWDRRDQA